MGIKKIFAEFAQLAQQGHPESLFRIVATKLRLIANSLLVREPPDIELERDVLVDDAFIELTTSRYTWKDEREFYGAAKVIMRRILDEHRRKRKSHRRGGDWQRVEAYPDNLAAENDTEKLLEIKEAIEILWKFHPSLAETLELYLLFGGNIENVAELLSLQPKTIKNRLSAARLFLKKYLTQSGFELPSLYLKRSAASEEVAIPRVETIAVQLTLDVEFNTFDEIEQKRFLQIVMHILDSPVPINLVSIRPGSTKVTIMLTVEQAEQLLWLYHRGVLRELHVKDAKIIGDEAAAAMIRHKSESGFYDVFLCHNSKDKPEVKRIALRLRSRGILPWLDEWELRPGLPWQQSLEEQIETISSVAVLVGDSGVGPWQDMELSAFIREFVKRKCPVIPVILKSCKVVPRLPPFLNGMMWVNFQKRNPNPYDLLIWGITGKKI